jgi:hypothetical protein
MDGNRPDVVFVMEVESCSRHCRYGGVAHDDLDWGLGVVVIDDPNETEVGEVEGRVEW